MGYGRAPAFGPEGVWNAGGAGGARGQVAPPAPTPAPVVRMDAPPVLVLQPGWGVTLPPYFLGMMDPKRPRNVPVKVRSLSRLVSSCLVALSEFGFGFALVYTVGACRNGFS